MQNGLMASHYSTILSLSSRGRIQYHMLGILSPSEWENFCYLSGYFLLRSTISNSATVVQLGLANKAPSKLMMMC